MALVYRKGKMLRTYLFLLTFLLIATSPLEARPLYKVVGKGGTVTFTNKKPKGKNYEVFKSSSFQLSKVYSSKGGWRFHPLKTKYDKAIYVTAVSHGLEPALVKAVVHVESAFNAKATSPKGAMGLMQLMPQTAKRFGVKNAYHPEQNLEGGSEYLKWLLDRYKGDIRLALAAYNVGEGVVDRLRNVPPYKETQNYVRRVKRAFKGYRKHQ